MTFTLDNRDLALLKEEKEAVAGNVLIVDTTDGVSKDYILENFSELDIENVGYPLMDVILDSICVEMNNGKTVNLSRGIHNRLSGYLNTNDQIRLFYSYFSSEESSAKLYDHEKW